MHFLASCVDHSDSDSSIAFLKYIGARAAAPSGSGTHSTTACGASAPPAAPSTPDPTLVAVSKKQHSIPFAANIRARHFLKFRISSHASSSAALVLGTCATGAMTQCPGTSRPACGSERYARFPYATCRCFGRSGASRHHARPGEDALRSPIRIHLSLRRLGLLLRQALPLLATLVHLQTLVVLVLVVHGVIPRARRRRALEPRRFRDVFRQIRVVVLPAAVFRRGDEIAQRRVVVVAIVPRFDAVLAEPLRRSWRAPRRADRGGDASRHRRRATERAGRRAPVRRHGRKRVRGRRTGGVGRRTGARTRCTGGGGTAHQSGAKRGGGGGVSRRRGGARRPRTRDQSSRVSERPERTRRSCERTRRSCSRSSSSPRAERFPRLRASVFASFSSSSSSDTISFANSYRQPRTPTRFGPPRPIRRRLARGSTRTASSPSRPFRVRCRVVPFRPGTTP